MTLFHPETGCSDTEPQNSSTMPRTRKLKGQCESQVQTCSMRKDAREARRCRKAWAQETTSVWWCRGPCRGQPRRGRARAYLEMSLQPRGEPRKTFRTEQDRLGGCGEGVEGPRGLAGGGPGKPRSGSRSARLLDTTGPDQVLSRQRPPGVAARAPGVGGVHPSGLRAKQHGAGLAGIRYPHEPHKVRWLVLRPELALETSFPARHVTPSVPDAHGLCHSWVPGALRHPHEGSRACSHSVTPLSPHSLWTSCLPRGRQTHGPPVPVTAVTRGLR